MKTLSLAYLALLSWGLVAKDPLGFLRGPPALAGVGDWMPAVEHLAAFLVLAVVMLAARWPVAGPALLAALAGYALASECVQAFLPWRTAELGDLLQDLAGLAIGGGLYWVGARVWAGRQGRR